MAFTDKKKFSGNSKVGKIVTKLSLSTIINLSMYALIDGEYCSSSNLMNLKKFLDSIDIQNSFDEEEEFVTIQYFNLLKTIVDTRLKLEINDINELYDYVTDNIDSEKIPENTVQSIFEKYETEDITTKKIRYWNQFIQDKLDYMSIYQDIGELEEIVEAFKYSEPKETSRIIPQAKILLADLNRKFNNNIMNLESTSNSFNPLNEVSAMNVITNSVDSILNPGNMISTGFRMLDDMMGGGMQESRVYLLLGQSKGFKSGTMLNIVMNVATKYVDYKLKDTTKIPAVLYFTMENSMNETFERIYNWLGYEFNFPFETEINKAGKKIKKYNLTRENIREIYQFIMKETYERTGIALRIEFKEHFSCDTGILDKFYDDYNTIDNQEIIFIAMDYIKRIRSQKVFKTEDRRGELGEIVNEFCNFAKSHHIPILTASQMNRQAMVAAENAKSKNKKDISRNMGGSMVGESNLILENADMSIITDREEDVEENKTYQTFNLIMSRTKTYCDYFAQPYDLNPKYKSFRIADDTELDKPLGIDRISTVSDANDIKLRENTNEAIKNRRIGKGTNVSINDFIDGKESKSSKEIDTDDLDFNDDEPEKLF
jgi:replicative DNA helicase